MVASISPQELHRRQAEGQTGELIDVRTPLEFRAVAIRILRKIGVEQIPGSFSMQQIQAAGLASGSYDSVQPNDIFPKIESGDVTLIDVRNDAEWDAGHIAEAKHFFLGRLPDRLNEIDDNQPLVAQCQSGARSAIATSILKAAGKNVVNLAGGFSGWQSVGLPTVAADESPQACSIGGTC